MTTMPFVLLALIGQTTGPPPPAPLDCNAPRDSAIAALCSGEELLRQAAAEIPPTEESRDLMRRAIVPFRAAASSAHDALTKKRALERLETLFDEQHLDSPGDVDPVLRELIAVSPGDLAPIFRLARLQEQQEMFDAAESTFMAAHEQKPNDVAAYRELAQYFSRRAAALSGSEDSLRRSARGVPEPGHPDADGVYTLGGSVQPPEQLSAVALPMPTEAASARVSGSVGLEAVIDEVGKVIAARIVRSVPLLDDIALATVRQWRFAPATLEGKPIRVRLFVVVNVRQ